MVMLEVNRVHSPSCNLEQKLQGADPNTGLVITLKRVWIAWVPRGPKSRAWSHIFSQLVEVAIVAAKEVLG